MVMKSTRNVRTISRPITLVVGEVQHGEEKAREERS